MHKITVMIFILVFSLLLAGCAEKMDEFKEAVSGIDTVADKAARSLSLDAISIREIEIDYNNEVFTVNDLFKTILRDVQWEYEEKEDKHNFTVNGTWKNPLFEYYEFTEDQKKALSERGKVKIKIELVDGKISPEATKVTLILDNKILVEENGQDALYYLYDYYTKL